MTGILEPAAILLMDLEGKDILYIPNFGNEREKWVTVTVSPSHDADTFGFDAIKYLSDPVQGYSYSSFFKRDAYVHFLKDLEKNLDDCTLVFSLFDTATRENFEHVKLFESLERQIPLLQSSKQDVSSILYKLRRCKDFHEINAIKKAIEITIKAHRHAAKSIAPGKKEHHIQAEIEYVFTHHCAQPAFPSIVASGKNATVLHYVDRNQEINEGDLVVVDIGAEHCYYAADLTRTYPANGSFSERQKEIYDIVLAAQELVAECARPGMFLRNDEYPEQSLHHRALKFFQQHKLDHYFPHGIGHFLGLDLHDVGNRKDPLVPGDVFTIEPGIYIPEEGLGIRIEDNYLMTNEGIVCLSADLPKKRKEIEKIMKS